MIHPNVISATMQGYLSSSHPFSKAVLYANVLLLSLFGAIPSIIILAVIGLVLLSGIDRSQGSVASPYSILVLFVISIGISLPNGDPSIIKYTVIWSIRMLDVLVFSAIMGAVISFHDVLFACRIFRLSDKMTSIAYAVLLFIPQYIEHLRLVIMAQKTRGARFGIRNILRPTTYSAIAIPFIHTLLRNALLLWVSINLRPISSKSFSLARPRVGEYIIVMFIGLLWLSFYL